jgi:hypothetical protein
LIVDQESGLPSAADFARLEGELFDRVTVRHRRQVLRHRLVAIAAVLVVAGAGVAAGTIASPTQQSKFAYCYSGSDTGSAVAQVGLPNNKNFDSKPGTTATTAQVANAVLLCKGLWRSGVFNTSSQSGPVAVPKLQVCLRDDLIVSVFRKPKNSESAEAFCNNLGLGAP